ncbi:protein LURP-one-related 6-like [Zingiber officinale]|uniref:protein LURP-one-related 6-like n=1 Tax=Zingiber officinale TaxID=94328 RepID=UPI001C4A9FF0|nr:protein LURP-one-related 6-like [Zingiber officinale]
MAGGLATKFPVVSKAYCSLSQTTLMIRKRPRNINGGGFVAMDTSQVVAFAVDGCCVLGVNGECMVKDGNGNSILFISKKQGGVLQAVSFNEQWRGFLMDFEMTSKLVFTLHEAKSWLVMNGSVKIFLEAKENGRSSWDFEVLGSFTDRACTIMDRRGNVVAEVKGEEKIASKEFYSVVVQPGHDQAFVIAVIAILDYINGESTRC